MNVAKLCCTNAVTVRPYADLATAAQLMRDRHVGYLVVVDVDLADNSLRPIGVLTDRDIVVTVVARQVNPRAFRVGDVMTERPVLVTETDSLEKTLETMRNIGVRRLPVVGNHGQLVGVVSLDDVIDELAAEPGAGAGSIRNERRVEGALRPQVSAIRTRSSRGL
jgi:CBS domain-containing protein